MSSTQKQEDSNLIYLIKQFQTRKSQNSENDTRIDPFPTLQYDEEEEIRENDILEYMDSIPNDFTCKEHQGFISYMNHISYLFSRISRALLYDYGNLNYKIVEESKKVKVQYIEPFLGYAGKQSNLIVSFQKSLNQYQDETIVKDDFRGIFCYGNSDTVYVIYHGSCQEYDWHANLDGGLVSPSQNLLPELNCKWKIHQGYAELIHKCAQYPQELKESTQIGFYDKLKKLIDGKQTIYFSGHSQGAGMSLISCVYTKCLLQKEKFLQYQVKGWVISLPRVFDQSTAKEVDQMFNVQQNINNCQLIRQNVLGDPVPMSFSSSKEVFQRIRSACCLSQIIMYDQFFGVIKVLVSDPKFVENLKKACLAHKFDIQGYMHGTVIDLIDREFFKPLFSEKYNGDFPKFLIDFSAPDISLVRKKIWDVLAKIYKPKIIQCLPKEVIEKLELTEDMITGSALRAVLHSIGKLLEINEESEDRLEDLIFETDLHYILQLEKVKLEEELQQKEKEKQFKELTKNFFKSIFTQVQKKNEGKEESSEENDNNSPLEKEKVLKEESLELTLSKRFLKVLYLSFLESKLFTKKLSCFGDVFEGLIYFSGNYGDCGQLLLDQLDFHKSCRRVDDLHILENFFGSQIKNIDISGLDMKLAFYKCKESVLRYLAPYHYGEPDLDASFDPELVIDSHIKRMYGYACYYEKLNIQQKDGELYRLGLLKKHQKKIHSMTEISDSDTLVMERRILSRIKSLPIVLENSNFGNNEQQKQDILYISQKFGKEAINQLILKNLEANQELFTLIKYSYFLSTIFKAVYVLYTDGNYPVEQQFVHLFKDFIQKISAIKEETNLEKFLTIHLQFLNAADEYIRDNEYKN